MCRMLIAIGSFSTPFLLENASMMAQDLLCEHELNQFQKGMFIHNDGWGIAQLEKPLTDWIIHKSPHPIWEDLKQTSLPPILTSQSNQPKVTIIHTRKATVGEIGINNTHPFDLVTNPDSNNSQPTKFIFCHNGTINEPIPPNTLFYPKGTTDSEKLFHQIVTKYITSSNPLSIQETINQFNYPGTSNIILSTYQKSFIAINCKKNPIYTQMYLHKDEQGIIISSEKIPTYHTSITLPGGTLLEINHNTHKIIQHQISPTPNNPQFPTQTISRNDEKSTIEL